MRQRIFCAVNLSYVELYMRFYPMTTMGGVWLAKLYEELTLAHLPVLSQIGRRRATEMNERFRLETYTEVMQPTMALDAHL